MCEREGKKKISIEREQEGNKHVQQWRENERSV